MPKYCWSTNEEEFHGDCESREAAIVDCVENEDWVEEGAKVWTAETVAVNIHSYITRALYNLLENIEGQAADDVGECAEGWLSMSKESENLLLANTAEFIEGWLVKHDFAPKFWGIKDVQEYVLTKEDIPDVDHA